MKTSDAKKLAEVIVESTTLIVGAIGMVVDNQFSSSSKKQMMYSGPGTRNFFNTNKKRLDEIISTWDESEEEPKPKDVRCVECDLYRESPEGDATCAAADLYVGDEESVNLGPCNYFKPKREPKPHVHCSGVVQPENSGEAVPPQGGSGLMTKPDDAEELRDYGKDENGDCMFRCVDCRFQERACATPYIRRDTITTPLACDAFKPHPRFSEDSI